MLCLGEKDLDWEQLMAEQLAEYLVGVDEFLAWESQQPARHELIDNRIYPMTGASREHNLVAGNLVTALNFGLREKGGEIYPADMRVQIDKDGTFTYPDVVVVSGEPRFRKYVAQDTLLNPTLLFEILSPSTELVDRNQKLEQYLRIPSLMGYFLVAQDKPLIEAHLRSGDDWLTHECAGLDSNLVIPTLDCEIPLREVYRQVRFE